MARVVSVLWMGFVAVLPCSAQWSLEEQREFAFEGARTLSRPAQEGEARREICLQLVELLKSEDVLVRAFAAYGLQCVSRDPDDLALAEDLRGRMEALSHAEDSKFVKPWLERGLGPYRPTRRERLVRVLSEPALMGVECAENCGRVDFSRRDLGESFAEWQAHLDQHERILELLGDRPKWESVRYEREKGIGRALVCLPIRILAQHSEEIFERLALGDVATTSWMERLEEHLLERMLLDIWTLEYDPEPDTAPRWEALARVFELERFEIVPKPNFHHDSSRGGEVTVAFGVDALPGIVEGLLHSEGRDLARAHRLLRMFGAEAELAAPFVIQLWELPEGGVMGAWLGSRWARYDAIAGCGPETIDLVRQATGSDDAERRRHACLALPRFGGPGRRGLPELTEALEDEEWRVVRAAESALYSFVTEKGPRAKTFGLATWVDKNTEPSEERTRRIETLCERLDHEDVYIRAFAARSLARVGREPCDGVDRELARNAMGRALTRETSVFVRPWLERGLLHPHLPMIDRLEAALSDPGLESLRYPFEEELSPDEKESRFHEAWLAGDSEENIAALAGSLLRELGLALIEDGRLGDEHALGLLESIDRAFQGYRKPLATRLFRGLSAKTHSKGHWRANHWRSLGRLYGWNHHLHLPHARYGSSQLGGRAFLTELGDEGLAPIVDALVHGRVHAALRAHRMLEAIGSRARLAAPFAIWRWGSGASPMETSEATTEVRASAFALCGAGVFELIEEACGDGNVLRATRANQVLRHLRR